MASSNPPEYAASSSPNNLQASSTLPSEVIQVLQNARFLHLATCTDLFPHVSLMNYTYLPTTPYSSTPTIIMTTDPTSKKTLNLTSNPHVSLLVHDWVSHRPPTTNARRPSASGSPPPSSLASLLQNLNTSALSSISATINGDARVVDKGTEEERYYKEAHLDNNTFEEGGTWRGREEEAGDGGRESWVEGEEVLVVVVRIRDGRVSDWKGAVRDWSLVEEEERGNGGMVNGVSS